MRIYVASSWRNKYQPSVVEMLSKKNGFDVYDFRNPPGGSNGFRWSEIDPNWQTWTTKQYAEALEHPIAKAGFASDMDGLMSADLCILVLPSGRSASWEYGYHCGMTRYRVPRSRFRGKAYFPYPANIVYMPEPCEPELMYRGSNFVSTLEDLERAAIDFDKQLFIYRDHTEEPNEPRTP